MTLQRTYKRKYLGKFYTIEDWDDEPCAFYLVKQGNTACKCQYREDGQGAIHALLNNTTFTPKGKIWYCETYKDKFGELKVKI